MKPRIVAAVLAGGEGLRFWPLSTPERPKQFLNLTGAGTLLQLTLRRLEDLVAPTDTFVLTQDRYAALVREQAPAIAPDRIILEPLLRDTAAAIALAAGVIARRAPGSVMAVLPSDHGIRDVAGFRATLSDAAALAAEGHFVTIAIPPSSPAESYGYLEKGEALDRPGCYRLQSFVEKPDRRRAQGFLDSGRYAWNAGMFLWRPEKLLEALELHLPAHAAMARALAAGPGAPDWLAEARRLFEPLTRISIDHGLMEKITNAVLLEARFDWSDVGGWAALIEMLPKDAQGNALLGHAVRRDTRGNLVIVEDGQPPLVAAGIENSVVICGRAGTLVCARPEAERLKDLVNQALGR